MPEGVEVKISAELIKPLVASKYIRRADVTSNSRYSSKKPDGLDKFHESFRDTDGSINMVHACKIVDVNVKGKFMYWTFDNGWYMFCTFGMTGQWSPIPGKHVCLKMSLYDSDGNYSDVYFNDPRHFGTIKFTNSKQELQDKLNELGWDPLDLVTPMNPETIHNILRKTSKPIGQILMDQSVFAGVGNYIRAEALYEARMSPWVQGNCLTLDRVRELCHSIIEVMKESYAHQGATILTYKDAYGAEGKYSSCFKVYGQKKDPLGNPIVKEETPDGRTIHWCPLVQCEKF